MVRMDHLLQDPALLAVPFFVLFIVLELVALRVLEDGPQGGDGAGGADARRAGYDARDSATSLSMGLGSVAVNLVVRALALLGYTALYAVSPLRLDPHQWWTWLLVVLMVDLLWYAYHRSSHRIRVLWAMHQAHHSSIRFNYTTALRQKWNPWGELLFWVPLPLLGVPPWMIFFVFSINLVYQFWVHTETVPKLWRPVELVFNTPSHHRVHHASDARYLDRNYGGILIVWDRLFGTFCEEQGRPTYGLTHPVTTYNPFRLQYGEFALMLRQVRQAVRWRDRFGYVFAPPGWTPER
jgi:sterol desaturase/sphingolipid hydroxylase (fatty acid hydroxylase superfamily)